MISDIYLSITSPLHPGVMKWSAAFGLTKRIMGVMIIRFDAVPNTKIWIIKKKIKNGVYE